MKQKITYNTLLIRYHKYKNKLQRLQAAGKNQHRQNVLKKHIERLQVKLTTLFSRIKRTTAMAAAVSGMLLLSAHINAQEITFGEVQQNPFGLDGITNVILENTTFNGVNVTFADLDGDGDFDVLSGHQTRNFNYYENIGDANTPTFAPPQENPFGLTDIGSDGYAAFTDLDGDGDFDLLSGDFDGDFSYFENIGDFENPSFAAPQTNPFNLANLDIGSFASTFPTLTDLDGDGDFDVLSGSRDGDYYYFENIGTNTTPDFATKQLNPFNLSRFGFARSVKPTFIDLDGDLDFDIIVGNQNDESIYYYENTGDTTTPMFAAPQENLFGLKESDRYSKALGFADLDSDGDFDALIGNRYGDFLYFENIGDVNTPNYSVQMHPSFLFRSTPSFADIDNDGDLDILSGDLHGSFFYFQNIGDANVANFKTEIVKNPFNLTASNDYSTPTLVDIDADGDFDIISGGQSSFSYFENRGDANSPNFEAPTTNPFNLSNPGYGFTNAAFGDIDNDGDLDLISGAYYGEFYYFENIGSASTPDFAASIEDPFNLTSFRRRYSNPTFVDIDNDGDLDLISGDYYGEFYYFENIGTPTTPNFAAPVTNPLNLTDIGSSSSPVFGDIDGDGDLDLFSGSGAGDFYFFENTSPLSITKVNTNAVSLYPNPTTGVFTIQSKTPNLESLTLHDILGKHVLTQPLDSSQSTHTIHASTLSKGIYVLTLSGADTSVTKKLVIK